MPQSPDDPPSNAGGQDTEPPDGKVVRLTPRRPPAPEPAPHPPAPDEDDDPGPSAA